MSKTVWYIVGAAAVWYLWKKGYFSKSESKDPPINGVERERARVRPKVVNGLAGAPNPKPSS